MQNKICPLKLIQPTVPVSRKNDSGKYVTDPEYYCHEEECMWWVERPGTINPYEPAFKGCAIKKIALKS
jgi:hypothetical protein